MTTWYESLDVKERRPYRLAVRKVMKAAGFTGSNQNLDIYADNFLRSEFGERVHKLGMWNNYHMTNDRLHEYMMTPEGDASTLGVKQDPKKDNVEKIYDKEANSSEGMNYYQAEKIRNTGFFQRLLDKTSADASRGQRRQGYGEALTNTISEGVGARVKMFKKRLDPMFLTKALLGGGTIGAGVSTALFGKNRSQADVDYFAGKKQRRLRETYSEIGNNKLVGGSNGEATQVLTDMLDFMKVSRTEDIQLMDTMDNYDRLNENLRESNHKELMDALLGVTGSKRRADKKMDAEAKKRKMMEGTRNKKKAAAESKQARQNEFSARRDELKSPTGGMSTPVKIAAGVAAAGATAYGISKLRQAMGGAESSGNYNVTFGDVADKSGKITNTQGYITTQSEYGKNLTDMTLSEVKEYGQKRSAKSKNSGAVGRYQFMPSTLFGKGGLVAEAGLSMDTKFAPEVQEKLQDILEKRNRAALEAKGLPTTDTYMYMAHYIGPNGAAAVYNSIKKGLDISVAQAMINHNLPEPGRQNNRRLYEIKVADFEMDLATKLAANLPKDDATPVPATPAEPPIRPDLNKMSAENADLWKSVKSSKQTVVNYFNQNNTTIAQKSVMFNTGPVKREPNPITGL